MAVNFPSINPASLYPISGAKLGWAEANIRHPNRKDLVVIVLDEGATVSAVLTLNRFCAAPVTVCREHLDRMRCGGAGIRVLVINAGNANAGTGAAGLAHARETCAELARLAGLAPHQVLPFSTGVILEPLPISRLKAKLPAALANCKAGHWYEAAQAIMTTDTVAKAASRQLTIDGHTITLTGISKGAGMIKPNMATMLGFLAIDAAVSQPVLDVLTKTVADQSFNCITVDGDTSTNDSFVIIASGQATLPAITSTDSPSYAALLSAATEVAQTLAQLIVRDGEGATKFITIQVEEGASIAECQRIAYAIGQSPLVKTAFYAEDPNLGRIIAAIGYAGVEDLDPGKIDLFLDQVPVAQTGSRASTYREEDGQRVMKQKEITVRVRLGRGDARATIWTCDFSHDYITINTGYRS